MNAHNVGEMHGMAKDLGSRVGDFVHPKLASLAIMLYHTGRHYSKRNP